MFERLEPIVLPIRKGVIYLMLPILVTLGGATGLAEVNHTTARASLPDSIVLGPTTSLEKARVCENLGSDVVLTGQREGFTDHLETLRNQLVRHEGIRLRPYRDINGDLSIGVGRNLSSIGISLDEALHLLDNDIARVTAMVDATWPWVADLTPTRRRVLYNMAFNLGITQLKSFKKMFAALKAKDYARASREMMRSRWASQVGNRAVELSQLMRRG